MKYQKLVAFIFIFLVSIFAVTAQDANKAKEILNKVSAKYKAYNAIKVDFKYTLELQGDKKFKETQTGTLYLKKSKFKLQMNDQLVICDGATVWTYSKDLNEVDINNYDAKTIAVNPAEIFSMWEKGYLYGYTGEEKSGKKTLQVIELTPENKKQNIFKVKLYINKANNALEKAKMYERNGNIYTYQIVKLTPNPKVTDASFTWDSKSHPGVKAVDNRKKKK